MKKHSINIKGHSTSLSLEDSFWHVLKLICEHDKVTLRSLIEEIDENNEGNLSSAVRVYVLNRILKKDDLLNSLRPDEH